MIKNTKKELNHKIICFFDKNRIEEFHILYTSLKNVYSNFHLIGFINFNEIEIANRFIFDKNLVEFKQVKGIDQFGKYGTPKHIDSIMSYGRLLANSKNLENINDKFIYLDVDIVVAKEFDDFYLDSKDNFVFTIAKTNKEVIQPWKILGEFRRGIHLRKTKTPLKKIDPTSLEIITMIKNKEYFNSGVIVINDLNKYGQLIDRINSDPEKRFLLFSDQDLLNYFNKDELNLSDDTSMNKMVYLSNDFDPNVSIWHFAGNESQKDKMKSLFKMNFDFERFFKEFCRNNDQESTYKNEIVRMKNEIEERERERENEK